MKKLVLVLASLLAAACSRPFSASVEAKRVCVHQLNQSVAGVGGAGATAGDPPAVLQGAVHDQFPLDSADLSDLDDSNVAATLAMQEFRMTLPPGTTVDQLHVVMTPPAGSGLEPVALIDYTAAAQSGLVQLVPNAAGGYDLVGDLTPLGADFLQYVKAGDVQLNVDAQGALPTSAWNTDVEVCAAASAEYDYL